MSECLHCEINELVQQGFEQGQTDLPEIVSMIAESLVDAILLAPEANQANLMAHATSAVGQILLRKVVLLRGAPAPRIGARIFSLRCVLWETAKALPIGQHRNQLEGRSAMTLIILDPCTGTRVRVEVQTKPQPRRRTRRELLSELDRPRDDKPGWTAAYRT